MDLDHPSGTAITLAEGVIAARDEILRLKQITGLAALFKDVKFGQAWRPAEEEEE